jgi:putative transposase
MRKPKFTEEQIVEILSEAQREGVSTVATRHGVSKPSIYTWRRRFGISQAHDVRRIRHLEAENIRLKRLVAERDLEIEYMKETVAKKR